jgi:hypothetical protein
MATDAAFAHGAPGTIPAATSAAPRAAASAAPRISAESVSPMKSGASSATVAAMPPQIATPSREPEPALGSAARPMVTLVRPARTPTHSAQSPRGCQGRPAHARARKRGRQTRHRQPWRWPRPATPSTVHRSPRATGVCWHPVPPPAVVTALLPAEFRRARSPTAEPPPAPRRRTPPSPNPRPTERQFENESAC